MRLAAWRSELRPVLGASGLRAVGAGLLTGGFGAWAYYDDFFRPLAHAFGIWILTAAILSRGQPAASAALRSVLALEAAVVAFFVGKKVMYGVDYPGMPYSVNADELVEWLMLGVIAGALLGLAFHRLGSVGRAGALSTAAAIGLILADAYRRSSGYPAEQPAVLLFAVVAAIVVLLIAYRSRRQLLEAVAWTLPMAAIGFVLVSLPDALEELLISGGL